MLKSLSSVCTVTQEDDTGEAGVGWQALRELADTFVFCQQSSRDRRAKIMPDSESHPVVLAARVTRDGPAVSAWSQTASFLPISKQLKCARLCHFLHSATLWVSE